MIYCSMNIQIVDIIPIKIFLTLVEELKKLLLDSREGARNSNYLFSDFRWMTDELEKPYVT